MTPIERRFTAPDGRTVAVAEWGDPDGVPVIGLHGTPGSRLGHPVDLAGVRAAGVRLLTLDRPGYGDSDRLPGRQVVDAAADVAVVIGALRLDRVAVTGGSGGGPHALAAAWALPHRVVVAECRTGVAPFDAEGLDWTADMDPADVVEFGWAAEGGTRLTAELHRESLADVDRLDSDRPAVPGAERDLSHEDRERLDRPEALSVFEAELREAHRPGVGGWVDDDLALVRAWGFDPAEIRVPVVVRWGVRDGAVPAAHGAWLAGRIPTAEPHPEIAEGQVPDPGERVRQLAALAARVRDA